MVSCSPWEAKQVLTVVGIFGPLHMLQYEETADLFCQKKAECRSIHVEEEILPES